MVPSGWDGSATFEAQCNFQMAGWARIGPAPKELNSRIRLLRHMLISFRLKRHGPLAASRGWVGAGCCDSRTSYDEFGLCRFPGSQPWPLVIPTSAVTRTAIIVCVLLATTTETDVGASQNIVRTVFIAVRAVGFATPTGTGAITSTPAGNGTRTGTTTTTTATDKPGNTPNALGPAGLRDPGAATECAKALSDQKSTQKSAVHGDALRSDMACIVG